MPVVHLGPTMCPALQHWLPAKPDSPSSASRSAGASVGSATMLSPPLVLIVVPGGGAVAPEVTCFTLGIRS